MHTKNISCLFCILRQTGNWMAQGDTAVQDVRGQGLFFMRLTMPVLPWKVFLTPDFCELRGGLQAEERGGYYSVLELAGMNNLGVISVKEQMSKTN